MSNSNYYCSKTQVQEKIRSLVLCTFFQTTNHSSSREQRLRRALSYRICSVICGLPTSQQHRVFIVISGQKTDTYNFL